MKKALHLTLLLFTLSLLSGCGEDDETPAVAATEATIIVENAMTSGITIDQFGVALTGEAVYDQLNGTSIAQDGTFTLYGVTACHTNLDIV